MKKIILSLAVAVAAISCNTNEEVIAPSIDTKNQITVNVLSSDAADAATRTVTTDDGEVWSVKWKQGDQLRSWTMSEDGTTKDEAFSIFEMESLGDAVSASFTGDAANDKIRFVYLSTFGNTTNYNNGEEKISINYVNQSIDMSTPEKLLSIFDNAVLVTEDLEDVSALTLGGVTPTMQNMVAGMKLNLGFTNLPEGYSYAITKVVVGSTGDAGYVKPTTLIKIDPAYAIDSENFYGQISRNAMNLNVTKSPAIESDNAYSIYFKSFEFDMPNAKKLQIQVTLKATDAKGSADVVKTFDIENTSGEDIIFERGKHHKLNKLCDYTGVEITTTTPEVGGGDDKPIESTKITSAEELIALATAVNGGANQAGVTYTLENDIDLEGSETNQWSPIGISGKTFQGVFDGQGHTISGLYISNETSYQGLFGVVGPAGNPTVKTTFIKNLHVKGIVNGGTQCGGVIGSASNTVILNCSFEGSIGTIGTKAQCAGGIVAQFSANSEIYNCYNLGNITRKSGQIGGIAGSCQQTTAIHNCYSAGVVDTNQNASGAIAGLPNNVTTSNIYSLINTVVWSKATGPNGTEMSEADMKAETFVTTLNDYVIGSECPYKDQLKEWTLTTDGYPTFK